MLWLDGEDTDLGTREELINVALMECDCVAQHTIVAGGEQACDPHDEGSGPPAHRSIIFDVFPRSADSRYFADMSRTVVRRRPSPELTKLYQTVKDAQEEAITNIRDGADGAVIHQGICDRFRKGWVQDRPGQRPHAGLLSRHGTASVSIFTKRRASAEQDRCSRRATS